jgi:hypothetical protein
MHSNVTSSPYHTHTHTHTQTHTHITNILKFYDVQVALRSTLPVIFGDIFLIISNIFLISYYHLCLSPSNFFSPCITFSNNNSVRNFRRSHTMLPYSLYVKGKGKFRPMTCRESTGGSRNIALLCLNLATKWGWVVNIKPWRHYTLAEHRYPLKECW